MDTTEINEEVTDISDLIAADGEKDETRAYEIGYHLLPTLDDATVEQELAALRDMLSKQGAQVFGERAPVTIDLAYSIEKQIDGKRQSFKTGHFGWIAFEAAGSSLTAIDEVLKANANILRYIIVKTSRDSVAATLADPTLDVGAPEAADESVSDEELDEALNTIEEKVKEEV